MTKRPEDPRVQGFLKAISTHTGVPVSELRVLWRGQIDELGGRGGDGSERGDNASVPSSATDRRRG